MRVIGLTGGIACGKSTVARMLGELGAEVIDADSLVHALQAPGTPVHAAIAERFGASVLRPDGTIDRGRLGALVFADPTELGWLEKLTHPAVVVETKRLLAASSASVVVIEAIKLVEAGMLSLCDELWIVVCRPDVQLARLVARGTDEAAARARIAAQPDLGAKLARADVIIDNSGSLAETRAQVLTAWSRIARP